MWARERRVWGRGGQVRRTCPGLLHTVRRTALGPKDASTSSPLGAAMVVAVVSPPLQTKKELARAGGRPRRATAGCSFGTRRGSPARNTLAPRRGAMQGSSTARTTRTGGVRWQLTGPTHARPRAGQRFLAGIAARATPPSACCRTVWPHGFLASSTSSKRWWPTPSRPRVWPPRPMRCAPTRSSSRGRCVPVNLITDSDAIRSPVPVNPITSRSEATRVLDYESQ